MTVVGVIEYDVRLNLKSLKSDITQAEKLVKDSSNKMESSQSKLDRSINTTTKSLGASRVAMFALAGAATAAAIAIGTNLNNAIARSDTLANFPLVMSNLKIGIDESRESIDLMAERLIGLPTSLDAAARSVQRLTAVNRDVKASTALFLGFNNAILAGGASMDLQTTAIEQLSQAYAKGKPDMIEWRALMSAMPAQLEQVAEAMGLASADQLGESLRTGKTSMDDFLLTVARLNTEGANGFLSFEEQARNATGGIQTTIANMNTAITRSIEGIIAAIGRENIVGGIEAVGDGFENVANVIGVLIRIITPLAPALAVTAGALGAMAVAQITVNGAIALGTKALVAFRAALTFISTHPIIAALTALAGVIGGVAVAVGLMNNEMDDTAQTSSEIEDALKNYEPPLRGATDAADEFGKKMAKIDEQIKEANEDYRYNLAQLVANKNENIARLLETLRAEEKTYNNAYQERLASFNKTQDKEELSHKEKTKALQNQINFLTKYNNAANQQQLSETQFALAQENAEYKKSTELRQAEFDAQTKSASEEYEKRRAESQKKLNEELALLEKHRKDVLSIRGIILRDEIENLQKSRDAQLKSLREQRTSLASEATAAAAAWNSGFSKKLYNLNDAQKNEVAKNFRSFALPFLQAGIEAGILGKTDEYRRAEALISGRGYASGGFTGRGAANEPAGIVHRGEYVLPQSAVNQTTGLPKEGVGGQNINVTLNLSGVMTSSKSDERAIANRFAKLINESIIAKTGKAGIAGV